MSVRRSTALNRPIPLRALPLILITLLTFSQLSQADDAAQRLTGLLDELHSFRASVRQLIMESSGSVMEESQIRFMMRRPDGFYWETLEPFPELIVTDGISLWNYQPDLLQLTIDDWQVDDTEPAAQLLAGRTGNIAEDYEISMSQAGQGEEFVLLPRDPASLYQQITLYFEQEQLDSILLVNTNGQRTLWEFQEREINPPLDDSLFQFQIPEGSDEDELDVIDNRSTN